MLETLLKQIKEGSGENKKLSLLPNDVVTALKKRVREGAEDQEQGWANALELVHKAYEVEGVVRPDPSMADAWKQYEEMLQYAVQQLAKNRGMDGDWRMSSSMFREAYTKKQKFLVTIGKDEFVTEGNDITDVVTKLTESVGKEYTPEVNNQDGKYTVIFSRFNIRNKTSVTVKTIS